MRKKVSDTAVCLSIQLKVSNDNETKCLLLPYCPNNLERALSYCKSSNSIQLKTDKKSNVNFVKLSFEVDHNMIS